MLRSSSRTDDDANPNLWFCHYIQGTIMTHVIERYTYQQPKLFWEWGGEAGVTKSPKESQKPSELSSVGRAGVTGSEIRTTTTTTEAATSLVPLLVVAMGFLQRNQEDDITLLFPLVSVICCCVTNYLQFSLSSTNFPTFCCEGIQLNRFKTRKCITIK